MDNFKQFEDRWESDGFAGQAYDAVFRAMIEAARADFNALLKECITRLEAGEGGQNG